MQRSAATGNPSFPSSIVPCYSEDSLIPHDRYTVRRYPFLFPLAGLSSGVTAAYFTYAFDFRLVLPAGCILLLSGILLRKRLPVVAAVTLLCALWGNAH